MKEEDSRALIQALDRLSNVTDGLYRRQSLGYAFWHGMVVGLGSTVGVAVILWLVYTLLAAFDFLPVVNRIGTEVLPYLQQR